MPPETNARKLQEERRRLSELIDSAVTQGSAPMLANALKQMVGTRYLGGETSRLQNMIEAAMDAKIRELIAEGLAERDDEIRQIVEARLAEEHLRPMAEAITDEFITLLRKGQM